MRLEYEQQPEVAAPATAVCLWDIMYTRLSISLSCSSFSPRDR